MKKLIYILSIILIISLALNVYQCNRKKDVAEIEKEVIVDGVKTKIVVSLDDKYIESLNKEEIEDLNKTTELDTLVEDLEKTMEIDLNG